MTGAAAKENMTALDFENIWVVGADLHTPGLKGFAKDAYNNYMKPFDIVVNFETNCDLIVEPKVGKAYSKLELPALQREGYVFKRRVEGEARVLRPLLHSSPARRG